MVQNKPQTARAARDALEARKVFSKPIVVEITPFSSFYAAESYHQDYYKKKPRRYESLSTRLRPGGLPRTCLGKDLGVLGKTRLLCVGYLR